ncbi:hypothetical protein ACLOJK_037468 [Asimina triloba]
MASTVKQESISFPSRDPESDGPKAVPVVDLSSSSNSSSDSDSDSDSGSDENSPRSAKKPKFSSNEEGFSSALPLGFLEPLSPEELDAPQLLQLRTPSPRLKSATPVQACRQFWKAGDYDGDAVGDSELSPSGNAAKFLFGISVCYASLPDNAAFLLDLL